PRDAKVVAERVRGYRAEVAERLRQAEFAKATAQARMIEEQKRRRLTIALALSIIALVLLAGGGWEWVSRQRAARAEEKAQRETETLRRVHKAMEEAATLREQARLDAPCQLLKWTQALAAARTARELLTEEVPAPELKTQIVQLIAELEQSERQAHQVARQRRMQNRLEEIRLAKTAVEDDHFDLNRADPDYKFAFREFGIDFDKSSADEVVQYLQDDAIREDLAPALVDWPEIRRGVFAATDPLAQNPLN